MKNPIISIIVPVYNAQNYIEKCLNSILNQDIKDFEIIVVNDASDDDTINILKNYAKNKQIVLINNEENLGTGESRNKGILFARGKYIGFVDNDDWVEKNYFSSMVKKMEEENSDICVSLKIKNHKGRFSKTHLLNPTNLKEIVFVQRTAPWAKVIRKEFLIKNNIKFDKTRGEDICPAFLSAYLAKKISYVDNTKYHCNIRQGSISRRKISYEDYFEIKLYKKILDFIRNKEDEAFFLPLIKERSLISFDFLYKNADSETRYELLKEYEDVFNLIPTDTLKEYKAWKIKRFLENLKTFLNNYLKKLNFICKHQPTK